MRRARTPARSGASRSQTRAAASPGAAASPRLAWFVGIARCYPARPVRVDPGDIMPQAPHARWAGPAPASSAVPPMQRLLRLAILLVVATLASACAVVAVADAAVTVAATAVKVTAKGVGAVADAV